MDPEFWKERWQARQIGFNLPTPHEYLVQHGLPLWQERHPHVLVPLCGKAIDMVYLAEQGARVTGAELVESAAQEFFQDAGVPSRVSDAGDFCTYGSTELAVRIFVGDFFNLSAVDVGPVTAAYDRAALVALPPALRERYVSHLLGLLPTGARILLVTLEYDQACMAGPPFAVLPDEVERLYADCQSVTQVASQSTLENEPRFAERGLSALRESAYWIVR
jgi:thiopurine S-methyltransferase